MTAERWAQVKELFGAALDMPQPERDAWLRSVCGADKDLRAEVERLLAQGDATLNSPAGAFIAAPADIAPGTRFGSYEIVEELAAGGMGRVYRARDVKLDRFVAFKIPHPELLRDADAVARFRREAQVLATLNHPGIASIYGVEECDGIEGLAMELAPGPTLAEQLSSGGMSMENKLRAARLIAEALDYAHKQGIVHRDLKPSNVKVTPDARIKLLDFGLAKIFTQSDNVDGVVVTKTASGAIIGTLPYMSPEQVQGKRIDHRTDIWAFGAILYEMLAGRGAFRDDTAAGTIAALLSREPDWSHFPAHTPMGVREIVQRCLQKDLNLRLGNIAEAAMAIRCCAACRAGAWPLVMASVPSAAAPPKPKRRPGWFSVAIAALALTLFLITAPLMLRRPSSTARPLLRLTVHLGPTEVSNAGFGPDAVLSPDGARAVFCSRVPGGIHRLSTRLLDQEHAADLPDTDNGHDAFMSPDGQSLAFFGDGYLKKLSFRGGPPEVLCAASDDRGGSWGDDGNIIFAPATRGGLYRVSAASGAPQPITTLDLARREKTHRWPQVLPGSKAVLFTAHTMLGNFDAASVEVQSLATGARKTLVHGGYFARYLPSGHLLYVRQGVINALRFDLGRLEALGPPTPVIDGVACDTGTGGAQFDFARNGTFIYRSGATASARWSMAWLDKTGELSPLRAKPAACLSPRFSPEGNQVAMAILGSTGYDVWIYDWRRDALRRLTFNPGFNGYPVWSPDGRFIAFESDRAEAVANIFIVRAERGGEASRLTRSANSQTPASFSPDGKRLAFSEQNPGTGSDLWTVPVEWSGSGDVKAGTPERFLHSTANAASPMFSPDGRWLAYTSDESGTTEVYVQPFAGRGRWQISSGGGFAPVWNRRERSLLFKTPDKFIMVSSYSTRGDLFVPEKPRLWAAKPLPESHLGQDFDLAPDGKRLAVQVLAPEPEERQPGIHVNFLINFFDELRRRVAAENR